MNKSRIISILLGLTFIIPASLWYGQHHGLLPTAAATEAVLYDQLFNSLLTIAAAIFLIVQSLLIYSMIKFRRRKGDDTDGSPIHDNFILEMIWTAVPTVLVIWVGIYSFDVYAEMQNGRPMDMGMGMAAAHAEPIPDADQSADESLDQPLNIDVQGMQFAWIFSYPGTEIQTSELHVPLGQEVKLNLSAADVIHAFWVPQFRLKQDTIPGMTTSIQFTPNKLGTYPIVCAELCGSYHGGMRAELFVDTPEDYATWLVQEQEDLASSNPRQAIAALAPHQQLLNSQAQKLGISPAEMHRLHHSMPQI